MNSKKIVILTNHAFMLYQFRKELIAELLKENDVCIGVPFGDRVEEFAKMGCTMEDTPLNRRGINPFTDAKLLKRYHEILKNEKPDLVLTYSIKPNIYGSFACRLLQIPYYVNVQGLGTAFQTKGLAAVATVLYKLALKKARVVFFENEINAELFRQKKIVKDGQVTVLPGAGINLEKYTYQPFPERDSVHFLYLGRIMKEKGMDEFFAAARRLKEKYGDKAVFEVVGFFEDEYKEQVEELQKDGVIVFHGFQMKVAQYYANASCVVLPSYHEGMSNVLLEAAASGRAVITSDIPGCREAVDEGISGWLCRARDAGDLYDKMNCFMEAGRDRWEQMGRCGREKMEREFDKKKVVQMTVKALERQETGIETAAGR